MVGLYYGQINFNMGWMYGLKAFTAAILGDTLPDLELVDL